MKAITILAKGKVGVLDRQEPRMRSDYIKVRTVAVGLNPTDAFAVNLDPNLGHMLGVDCAGIVEEVGDDCSHFDVKPGDAVYGVCFSNNRIDDGSFAEKVLIKDGHLARIPGNISFEEAATLGTNLVTIGHAFYHIFQLPLPEQLETKAFPILIHGGGTSTGTLAIQMAKLQVIATCSSKSRQLVERRGADAIFDYHDPECGSKIRAYTNDNLHLALNCVGDEGGVQICGEALSSRCNNWVPNLVSMFPVDKVRKGVSAQGMLAYTSFGEEFVRMGGHYFPPMRGHYEHAVQMWRMISRLISEGKVKPHPHEVRPGGLASINDGLMDLWNHTNAGLRLVYRTADAEVILEKASTSSE